MDYWHLDRKICKVRQIHFTHLLESLEMRILLSLQVQVPHTKKPVVTCMKLLCDLTLPYMHFDLCVFLLETKVHRWCLCIARTKHAWSGKGALIDKFWRTPLQLTQLSAQWCPIPYFLNYSSLWYSRLWLAAEGTKVTPQVEIGWLRWHHCQLKGWGENPRVGRCGAAHVLLTASPHVSPLPEQCKVTAAKRNGSWAQVALMGAQVRYSSGHSRSALERVLVTLTPQFRLQLCWPLNLWRNGKVKDFAWKGK